MNRRWIAPLLVLMALSACAALLAGCGAKNQMAELTANPWAATQLLTADGHTSVLPGTVPAIYFRSDGTVIGNATVNPFRGPYTLDGRSVQMGPLVATDWVGGQQEMVQDETVLNALRTASRYVIQDGELQLSNSAGELLANFQVAQEPRLVGPVWVATSLVSEQGELASVVGSAPIAAEFSPDGTLAGSTGVNQYSAPYTATGSQMTIGPEITSTKMAGDELLMAQEARYLDALSNTASFKIGEYQLTLLDASGAELVVLIPAAPKN